MADPTLVELTQALARREFVLAYQPMLEVRTGKVAGFEALVRWRHPALGMVGPERFIQRCEEGGLIAELGRWVLTEACRQRAAWRDAGIGGGPISVNVSPLELRDPAYVETVRATLRGAGLEPQLLELEITETALVASFAEVKDAISALRRQGVGVALDDFGTGYSFLRSLRSLGVSKLKIPIEFICGLGEDPDCDAILEAVLALGHRLGLNLVAEGVETADQLALLRDRGCDLAQGNFLCAAVSADAVQTWIERGGLAAVPPLSRGREPAAADGEERAERRIRVLVVDDHDLARRTIVRILAQAADIEVVGEARDGQAALDLAPTLAADVVLLDVSMPRKGGLETLRGLRERRPDLALLVLSMHPEDPYALRFLREGAHGYMLKERAADELVGALRTVHAGRRYVSQAVLDKLVGEREG
ncbi:MAG TPA: EAL domain-containing protein [Thermoanaerobaculia bacterium]|nr:EAL domain-containing protein [Thermoanaerobaculia bacterium]